MNTGRELVLAVCGNINLINFLFSVSFQIWKPRKCHQRI